MRRSLLLPVGLMLLATPQLAWGEETTPAPAQGPSSSESRSELGHLTTWRPAGIAFAVGGGIGAFTDSALRDRAAGGAGVYDFRGMFGSNSYVAIELAHFGLIQRFQLASVDEVRLLALGAEAAIRVNVIRQGGIQPYLVGGAGWTHVNLLESVGDLAGDDDRKNLIHYPLGAGVAFYFDSGFVFDVRAQGRLTTETENKLFSDIDSGNLSTWAATAQLGWLVP